MWLQSQTAMHATKITPDEEHGKTFGPTHLSV